jgi:hypothetical protein
LQIQRKFVPSDSLETAKSSSNEAQKTPEPSLCMTIAETVGSTQSVNSVSGVGLIILLEEITRRMTK